VRRDYKYTRVIYISMVARHEPLAFQPNQMAIQACIMDILANSIAYNLFLYIRSMHFRVS
jgi:hypothetical protein